jgi:hypothetical protein
VEPDLVEARALRPKPELVAPGMPKDKLKQC